MKAIRLAITPSGTVSAIHDDELAGLFGEGTVRISRASMVEPTADGQWTAEMVADGTVLGPYKLRSEALAAERDWLEERMF
jgi:hypothetical protein